MFYLFYFIYLLFLSPPGFKPRILPPPPIPTPCYNDEASRGRMGEGSVDHIISIDNFEIIWMCKRCLILLSNMLVQNEYSKTVRGRSKNASCICKKIFELY